MVHSVQGLVSELMQLLKTETYYEYIYKDKDKINIRRSLFFHV